MGEEAPDTGDYTSLVTDVVRTTDSGIVAALAPILERHFDATWPGDAAREVAMAAIRHLRSLPVENRMALMGMTLVSKDYDGTHVEAGAMKGRTVDAHPEGHYLFMSLDGVAFEHEWEEDRCVHCGVLAPWVEDICPHCERPEDTHVGPYCPLYVPPAESKVVDLMAALEQSVKDARSARKPGPQPPPPADTQSGWHGG